MIKQTQFQRMLVETIPVIKRTQMNDHEVRILINSSVKEVVDLLNQFENESVPNGKRKKAMVHHIRLNAYSVMKGEDLTISFYAPGSVGYNIYISGTTVQS